RRELVADAWHALLAEAGLPVERLALGDAYDSVRREYWAAWRGNRQFTAVDAVRSLIEGLDGDGSLDHVADALLVAFLDCSERAEVLAVAGVDEVVPALKSAGVAVGIVCDVGLMPSRYLRAHLERHGLLQYFDHWSFSDEVGVYKPDRRIFEHALDGLGGVDPALAAHVGDRRRTDVAGALGMGMWAVRLTAVYDDEDPEEGPSGDVVVASYDELLPALGL
ncbi:MAG: HAD-IA family hydrolase, partial [Actinobacteria bacterium]|nr:HAD-IA family hydrolase [Actinomycetota bacterium]